MTVFPNDNEFVNKESNDLGVEVSIKSIYGVKKKTPLRETCSPVHCNFN